MFLSTGAFVRATFADGLLSGNCYIRPNSEYAFIMRMDAGILEGKATIFDFTGVHVKVLNYTEGKYQGLAKEFERSVDTCHSEITTKFYGQDVGSIKRLMDLTNKIRNKQGIYFGTFALNERVWYYGAFENGQPNGLGIMIDPGSKVQMGYFENGSLSGFGRIMWPNGVVMDGTIQKNAINEEAIVYNQTAHDWFQAYFKDNSHEEEISRGEGYPRDIHKSLFKKYFKRQADKKCNIDLSTEIFSSEVEQEMLFGIVYGEKASDGLSNHFKFKFSGEKAVEFDSRKDIEDLRGSKVFGKEGGRGGTTPSFRDNQKSNGQRQSDRGQESNYDRGSERNPDRVESTQRQSSQGSEVARFGGPSSPGKGFQKLDGPGYQDQGRTSNNPGFTHESYGGNGQQDSSNRSQGQGDNKFGAKLSSGLHMDPNKTKFPTPTFDRLDMLIIQRSLNWDNDKTLNAKNKFSRKPVSSRAVSDETKLNIVKNYVEDFMENFLDKKTIDGLMGGVEAYQILKAKGQL